MRKIQNPAAEIALPGFEVFHDDFLASRKEELALLKSAVLAGDFKLLTQMTHKWKGFCTPYGFQELNDQAIKLEAAALASDTVKCTELLSEIHDYLGDD